MTTFFIADLIPGMLLTPLMSSRILWINCCLFTLFLSLTHFLMHLLNSFSRCFPSLGVLLLSSMSLRISASFLEISSVSFAAAVSPSSSPSPLSSPFFYTSFMLLLTWNTIEPASATKWENRAWRPSPMMRSASNVVVLRPECSSPDSLAITTATIDVASVDVLSLPLGSGLGFFVFFHAVVLIVSDKIVVDRDEVLIFIHCAEYRTSTMSLTSFIWRLLVASIIVHCASLRMFFTCHFCILCGDKRHGFFESVTTLSLVVIPLHILSTFSALASAFSLFALAAAFSFFTCAFISSFSACATALFVVAVFSFYLFNDLLVSFFSLPDFNVFFLLGLVFHTQSCRVFSLYSCDGCSFQDWWS